MVDIGSLFGDENEDFRNKAKVSTAPLTLSPRKRSRSIALRKTSQNWRERCIY